MKYSPPVVNSGSLARGLLTLGFLEAGRGLLRPEIEGAMFFFQVNIGDLRSRTDSPARTSGLLYAAPDVGTVSSFSRYLAGAPDVGVMVARHAARRTAQNARRGRSSSLREKKELLFSDPQGPVIFRQPRGVE